MKKFDKDTTIGEVLEIKPEAKEVLMGFGMHCFGCPMALSETLEEACMVHGIHVEFLLKKLNEK